MFVYRDPALKVQQICSLGSIKNNEEFCRDIRETNTQGGAQIMVAHNRAAAKS
jgi:hypothetical protein